MRTSHILRPVREGDLPFLETLAASVRGGLTTLPNDPQFLEQKIIESMRSFDPRIRKAGSEYYLFVLEDNDSGEVVGTSGITARVGGFEPFYSYEIRTEAFSHPPLGIEKEVRVLHLKRNHKGPSEACSLFLRPDQRAGGLGRLLSLSRFLFMGIFRQRFAASVLAELRGWQDASGRSPFWESVGRHFFDGDYTTADFLSGLGNKAFIEDLMPEYPIYISLLPTEVQAVIGHVHTDTEPAFRLLMQEGFSLINEVDIFDAGPIVQARLSDLRAVRETRTARIGELASAPPNQPPDHLVANRSIDFRACLGHVEETADGTARLSADIARALGVEPGVGVIWAPLRSPKSDT